MRPSKRQQTLPSSIVKSRRRETDRNCPKRTSTNQEPMLDGPVCRDSLPSAASLCCLSGASSVRRRLLPSVASFFCLSQASSAFVSVRCTPPLDEKQILNKKCRPWIWNVVSRNEKSKKYQTPKVVFSAAGAAVPHMTARVARQRAVPHMTACVASERGYQPCFGGGIRWYRVVLGGISLYPANLLPAAHANRMGSTVMTQTAAHPRKGIRAGLANGL